MLLEGSVWRGNQKMYGAQALNDVVLNRAGRGGMIELRVELDGSFMYSLRADGLIIATPTGSTAYALSASGPLVHPAMAAMVLVPVAPQTLSNRPIVLADATEIAIEIVEFLLMTGDHHLALEIGSLIQSHPLKPAPTITAS